MLCSIFVLGLLSACPGPSDKKPIHSETVDTEPACESLRGTPCGDCSKYACDECDQAYACIGCLDSPVWGISDWDCKCINEDGELELYDTATGTGDPECRRTE